MNDNTRPEVLAKSFSRFCQNVGSGVVVHGYMNKWYNHYFSAMFRLHHSGVSSSGTWDLTRICPSDLRLDSDLHFMTFLACTTPWNILKIKETAGVLSNRHWTGRPKKTTAVDDRNIVRAVKKSSKTSCLWHDKQSPPGQGWRYLHQLFDEDLESRDIEAIPQESEGRITICKEVQRWAAKVLEQTFIGLMRTRWTSTNVKASVEKEGIYSCSKTYMLFCEVRWRKCLGLGLHGCFWSGL